MSEGFDRQQQFADRLEGLVACRCKISMDILQSMKTDILGPEYHRQNDANRLQSI